MLFFVDPCVIMSSASHTHTVLKFLTGFSIVLGPSM